MTMLKPLRTTMENGEEHPFLDDIHSPMTEEMSLTELEVTGTIPPALDGRYLRTGPNPVEPDPDNHHWFVGDGMVHGIAISGGKALWYRNRWIRSEANAAARGVDPAPGPRRANIDDNVNTNVVKIGGRTFVLIEAGSYPLEIGELLDTQGYDRFGDTLKGGFAAHPHLDPKTGETHAICYDIMEPTVVRHVVVNADGRVIREEPVPVEHGPMMHDGALTDRFAVILDLPVTFSMEAAESGHPYPFRWNDEHQARVGLLPRHGAGDDVIWCDVPQAYAFHVANSYDRADGRVVLDICPYDTMFQAGAKGPDAQSRGLERWVLDPVSRAVEVETLDPAPQDFPRPDERFFGQPYRHVWSVALPDTLEDRWLGGTALIANDLETGQRQRRDFGAGRHPGEFVFVPETPDSPEGHGWLMGFVVDMNDHSTDLVILDARRFQDDPVARIRLPHRIPAGFHGNWNANAG